jgi:hypothetical protein
MGIENPPTDENVIKLKDKRPRQPGPNYRAKYFRLKDVIQKLTKQIDDFDLDHYDRNFIDGVIDTLQADSRMAKLTRLEWEQLLGFEYEGIASLQDAADEASAEVSASEEQLTAEVSHD